MLNNASGFRRIYLATGYTDLRRGMEGLASIIKFNFQLDPYQKDILFLFCGRRTDRIKGLVWEGDGFLLLYKRLEPSTGPAQKKKLWRSRRSSTSISCRDLRLLRVIQSRKSGLGKSYKVLCKTEKIKKYLPDIICSEKELSTFHDPLFSFIQEYFQAPYRGCG